MCAYVVVCWVVPLRGVAKVNQPMSLPILSYRFLFPSSLPFFCLSSSFDHPGHQPSLVAFVKHVVFDDARDGTGVGFGVVDDVEVGGGLLCVLHDSLIEPFVY